MSRMDDDLFTYEVKIPGLASIPCDLNEEDDSEQQMTHGSDVDMEYDPSNVEFTERGDDEVELTNVESSYSDDDDDEVAEIFSIDNNVFDFETPTCRAFKEFNYLLQIKDIDGFKTYKEYKDDWIYEWNKDIPRVHEKPWTDNGWKYDGYCNGGNLPGAYIVGNILRYQDLEWYEALEDGKLKDEALKIKAVMKGIINEDDESHNEGWRRWHGYKITINDHEERENEKEHGNEERCELFDNPHHKTPVCKIRRFEMIKYSFGQVEECVAIKECKYDDLTKTNEDSYRAYQEIFRSMDEG
ncbi:hypothetical protein Tco_0489786 [Tanacetum coccineum]